MKSKCRRFPGNHGCLCKGGRILAILFRCPSVIYWKKDGEDIKQWICERYPYVNGNWGWVVKNADYYFRPGLTWPLRTTSGISFRIINRGAIFGHKGPSYFIKNGKLPTPLLTITQSSVFSYLMNIQIAAADAAARSYEVGVIQKTPFPINDENIKIQSTNFTNQIIENKRNIDKFNEMSHIFIYPSIIQSQNRNLDEAIENWHIYIQNSIAEGNIIQNQIDEISFENYGISDSDKNIIRDAFSDRPSPVNAPSTDSINVVIDCLILCLRVHLWSLGYPLRHR